MKPLTKAISLLCACFAILLGFALPWAVAVRQDNENAGTILQYETPNLSLEDDPDLFRRLELAASATSMLTLSDGVTVHTEEEVQGLVTEALDLLASYGLTVFSSDRWSFHAACQPLLATDTGETMFYDTETQSWSAVSNQDLKTSAAILWEAQLTTPLGERLTLLVDDALGLVLSFVYEGDLFGEKGSQTSVSLSDETAGRMGEFCREYYQLEDLQTTASDSSWRLTFFNSDNEKCWVTLSDAPSSLFFNASDDLHRSMDDSRFTDAFPSSN